MTGEYEYNPSSPVQYHHFRKVQWVLMDVDLPVGDVYSRNFSQQTLYKLKQQDIRKEFFVPSNAPLKATERNEPLNYVLIIDEINRGNISQIFGELITLLEDDKRTGKLEALTVTLPYSKKVFSVPPNLYVIGTMNTADRSVEALDTALRRRFVFEPMMPKPELLEQTIPDLDLSLLLQTINQRLEVLLTKDHTIGHAWLMDVYNLADLQAAFKNKILPLLQEYFYNNYAKIGLVLGDAFFEESVPVKKGLYQIQLGSTHIGVIA